MARPYGYELRIRALRLIDEGKSISKVRELLNISRQTLYTWKTLREGKGHLDPKKGYQKGHSHKIPNLDEFKEFIDSHKDKSLRELAGLYGKCSPATIGRAIKRIGYSYKKNFYSPKKG